LEIFQVYMYVWSGNVNLTPKSWKNNFKL
jgi:hypothetical protein